MMRGLIAFADWLGSTALSAQVTAHDWLVPALQVVHILAIAAVLAAALHIHLRALGVLERDVTLEAVSARFLPILWGGLAVLAVTGFLLIASEPNRAIFRTVFWAKLALAVLASIATAAQRSRGQRGAGQGAPGQDGALVASGNRLLAVAALIGWALVIYAGRWIAYADPWPGAPS